MLLPLDEHSLMLYAAQAYDNPNCFDTQEFLDDLKRVKYIKRLLGGYKETGELKTRLILNHLVAFFNVFHAEAAQRILFLRLKGFYPQLVPLLDFIGFLPEKINSIGIQNQDILTATIEADPSVILFLKALEVTE